MAQGGLRGRIAGYYAAEYAASSAFNGFVTLFYAARGMDAGQVSLLMAAGPLVALFALPVTGALADRARRRALALCAVYGLCALSSLCFLHARGFWTLLCATALFSCFSTCVSPLGEALALSRLHAAGLGFGRLRMAGTVSYALGSLLLGAFLDGGIERFVPSVCALYALGGACSLLLASRTGQTPGGAKKRPPFLSLLRRRELRTLLLFALCLQAAQGVFYALYGLFMTQSLHGTRAHVGLGALVGTLSEIPFLLFADRLLRRLGAPRLLLLSAAGMALRLLLTGLSRSPAAAIAAQALCVGGVIVCAFAMAQYVSLSVPQAQAASGQMLLYVFTYAAARTLGSLLALGLTRLPSLGAALCACAALPAALLLFARPLLRLPPLPTRR